MREPGQDRKHNMLEELKGDICSWCKDRRKKEIVDLVIYMILICV